MIVVTGGSGLLGSHLLFDLCQKKQKVRAIKRPNSDLAEVKKTFAYYCDDPETLFKQIEWIDADVTNVFSLEEAFRGAKQVYHAAAMVSFLESDRARMQEVNVKGTANVVNAALQTGIEKLCYVSSIAALGTAESNEETTEETPWKASAKSSPYSQSKYLAELEVWRGMEEGLPAVIVNPSIILGPAKWNSGSAALFSLIWKGLKFYPSGVNGYVYVRDVSNAMISLMESSIEGMRFTLSAEDVSYQRLFSLMAEKLGVKKPTIETKSWMNELAWRGARAWSFFNGKPASYNKTTARTSMQKRSYSNQKIKEALSFVFTPIDETIALTAKEFLKDHP